VRSRSLAVLAIATQFGCSAIFIRPTPQVDPVTHVSECSSLAWILADTMASLGTVALTSFAVGLSNGTNGYNGCDTDPNLCHHSSGTGGYVLAGAFGASALYGAIAGTVCARAQ
jgi:hypothetical protein